MLASAAMIFGMTACCDDDEPFGGGLSLSVSAMNYTDGNGGNSYPGPAFSYSGSVKKLPESAK